jgi:hypothetical protein
MVSTTSTFGALECFVGVWNTQGRIMPTQDAAEQLLVATDTYEWLPGKRFMLHRVDARLGTEVSRSIEVIGWNGNVGELFSTSYDDKGLTSHFHCKLEGQEWIIDGDGIRFRGSFNHDHKRLSGTWEKLANSKWESWMDIELTKAD